MSKTAYFIKKKMRETALHSPPHACKHPITTIPLLNPLFSLLFLCKLLLNPTINNLHESRLHFTITIILSRIRLYIDNCVVDPKKKMYVISHTNLFIGSSDQIMDRKWRKFLREILYENVG